MKKKVSWPEASVHSPLKKSGSYGSYREFLAKANELQAEQQQAIDYLTKAMPAMVKLLEMKIMNKEPLIVMRPLHYQTSDFAKSQHDEIDDSFYNTKKSDNGGDPGKFVDMIKVINPGTQLMFKSLDPHLQEFIFEDAMGKEHAISFDDRNKILTQTNIFETVRQYFEEGELK